MNQKRKAETSSTTSTTATKGLHKDKKIAVVKTNTNTNSPSTSPQQQPSQATSSIHNADQASASFDPLVSNLELYRPANRGVKLSVLADHQALHSSTQRPVLWPLVTFTDHIEVSFTLFIRLFIIHLAGLLLDKVSLTTNHYSLLVIFTSWSVSAREK